MAIELDHHDSHFFRLPKKNCMHFLRRKNFARVTLDDFAGLRKNRFNVGFSRSHNGVSPIFRILPLTPGRRIVIVLS